MTRTLLLALLLSAGALYAAPVDRIVKDPIQFVLDEADQPEKGVTRFALDINDDRLPDLFVAETGLMGNGGGDFRVFLSRAEGGYQYVGSVFLHTQALELLDARHNGVHDLLVYHRDGGKEGDYNEYHFDGRELLRAEKIRGTSKVFAKAIKPLKLNVETLESP